MAEEELAVEAGGGKKKMLIIIIAVVVLLIGGGVAAYMMLAGGSSEEVAESAVEETEAAPEEAEDVDATQGDAFYVGMPRAFVFNAMGHGRDRLVQIKVKLLVRGGDRETAAKKHIPLIEDTLLTVFSASDAEMLASQKGKEELRQMALESVQKALEPIVGNPVVEKVLFTGFVMQ